MARRCITTTTLALALYLFLSSTAAADPPAAPPAPVRVVPASEGAARRTPSRTDVAIVLARVGQVFRTLLLAMQARPQLGARLGPVELSTEGRSTTLGARRSAMCLLGAAIVGAGAGLGATFALTKSTFVGGAAVWTGGGGTYVGVRF